MHFLSIIIPTYNRAHLIENTLKSVLNQTCQDFEVIVIDDGSTDHTEEVLQTYINDRVFYHKIENSERGAARNYGTRLAKGKYVNWFDSDDIMYPNHVATLIESAEKYTDQDIFILNFDNFFPETNLRKLNLINPSLINSNPDRLIIGNFFSCNGVIVRHEIALKDPFIEDRKLSASEDYELWLRFIAQYKCKGIDTVTTTIIHHDQRSVYTMNQIDKLENRFVSFINYTTTNEQIRNYLGNKLSYFIMRNYLILAVDLAYNNHKKKAFHYLKLALKTNFSAINQRVFWGTVKHLLF